MRNYFAVCCLAVVLCLVVCVSANNAVNKAEAEREVEAAKETATRVLKKAQDGLKKVDDFVQRVEVLKSEATQALSQADEAPKDNKEAVVIAGYIKSSLGGFDTCYSEAKKILDDAISSLTTFLKEAKQWEGKSNIEIPNEGSTTDYTEIKRNATTVRVEAEYLDGRITNALPNFDKVDTNAKNMVDYLKDAKYESLRLSVVVAVDKIDKMMKDQDSIITETENKKNEVNRIVEKMESLKTNVPSRLTKHINELLSRANEALRNATEAVEKATNAKKDMPKHKQTAADALTNFPSQEEANKVQEAVQKAEESVRAVEAIVLLLQSALQTADNSVTNAKLAQEKMEEALAKGTSEEHTQQTKGKEKGNQPVQDGTGTDQKDTTKQQTITDTEQPTSKELPTQSDNRSEEITDTLSTGAQNVPTTALTGGKAPEPGAENDSAMTVSVPLLVALIASAVLQ